MVGNRETDKKDTEGDGIDRSAREALTVGGEGDAQTRVASDAPGSSGARGSSDTSDVPDTSDGAKARRVPGKKTIALIAAALCVCLVAIGVCVASQVSSGGRDLFATTQEAGQKSTSPSAETAHRDDAIADGEDGAEAAGKVADETTDASADSASEVAAASAGASSSGGSSGTAASSDGAASTGSSSSSGSSGSTGSSSAPEPAPEPAPAPAPATITVTVSVDSSAVGGPVSYYTSVTLSPGATVYDALAASGIGYNAQQSQYGVYVSAIGGLAEKEHGSGSGWKYFVNGAYVPVSCSSCQLNDGDSIQWTYVTG